jgi:hypothetical protein
MTTGEATDALAFFNRLSGRLHIELTEPAIRLNPRLLNLAAPAAARVTRVSFELEVHDEGDFRPLTDEEWTRVVIEQPRIRICSLDAPPEVKLDLDAPDGRAFTVRDLRDAIEETERQSRDRSRWLGGVDVHHVYFEGIFLEKGLWQIAWGS